MRTVVILARRRKEGDWVVVTPLGTPIPEQIKKFKEIKLSDGLQYSDAIYQESDGHAQRIKFGTWNAQKTEGKKTEGKK